MSDDVPVYMFGAVVLIAIACVWGAASRNIACRERIGERAQVGAFQGTITAYDHDKAAYILLLDNGTQITVDAKALPPLLEKP